MSAYSDTDGPGHGGAVDVSPRLAAPPLRGSAPAATPGPREADDASRRALADRITEDVLQLLFTAHQDLAEIAARGTMDGSLLRSAQKCTLGAVAILRAVAGTMLDAAWGPRAEPAAPEPAAAIAGPRVPFDALGDAWIVTVQHDKLLFASDRACSLLQRDTEGLSALMHDGDGWSRTAARHGSPASRPDALAFVAAAPMPDGTEGRVRVESYALPVVGDLPQAYISLLALV